MPEQYLADLTANPWFGGWNLALAAPVGGDNRATPPAYRLVLLIQGIIWLAALFAGAVFYELLWLAVVWLLRLPLKVMDHFAAFWLFVLSPAYRALQLASYREARSAEQAWLRAKAAMAICAGLGVAGAVAAFALA